MIKMKLYTFTGMILIILGCIGASYGVYVHDDSSIGIIAISLSTTWGIGFAFLKRRNESKREIVFK